MSLLTAEQRQPLELARGPAERRAGSPSNRSAPAPPGAVIATVAGPGSGKTTMQEALAVDLRQKGHQKILKLFFNKSAAEDGERRLNAALQRHGIPLGDPNDPHVLCKTTHSAALRFVKDPMRGQTTQDLVECTVDEAQLQKIILRDFANEIRAFHGVLPEQAPAGEEREKARRDAAKQEKLIAFWIFKSFVNWLASKLTEQELQQLVLSVGRSPHAFDAITYYPAKIGHSEKIPKSPNGGPGSWYLRRVTELWHRMCNDPTSKLVHDAYLKWAQVRGCRLELYTALLLDEAQDLTECQLDLFVAQPARADIFIVGDMAQALYAWRHAAPKQLASLGRRKPGVHSSEDKKWFFTLHGLLHKKNRAVTVTKLTQTFRFGEAIARIANGVLHIKEHSDQTGEDNALWVPYRVVGRSGGDGAAQGDALGGSGGMCVTAQPLSFPKTIVGRTNLGLAKAAWELLDQDAGVRIALNGDGDGAGRNKFATVFRELKAALRLYHSGKDPSSLPDEVREAHHASFDEFESWEDMKRQVEERELNQFHIHMNLCQMHGDPVEAPALLGMIERFQTCIIDRAYPKDECDALLSTVCQAKGLEWPRVEVLNDCIDLSVLGASTAKSALGQTLVFAPNFNGGELKKKSRPDFKGDEINSWFVAVTRAMEALRLPQKWHDLVEFARTATPQTPGQAEMWESLGDEARAAARALLRGLCDELGVTPEHAGADDAGVGWGEGDVGEGEADDEQPPAPPDDEQPPAPPDDEQSAAPDDEQPQAPPSAPVASQGTVTRHYRSRRVPSQGDDNDDCPSPSKVLRL